MTDGREGCIPLLLATAKHEPDRLFATFDGAPFTFGELDRASAALAAALYNGHAKRGDRIAVMMRNSRSTVVTIIALARAGLIWVPVNAQQRGDGLRYILDHGAPRLLIVSDDLLPTVMECGTDLSAMTTLLSRSAPDLGALEEMMLAPGIFADPVLAPDDTLAISYTSGTTGKPKGVLVSNRMLRLSSEAALLVADVHDGDVLFLWEPLYHIGGSQMLLLPALRRVHLAMVSRFSASSFWQDVSAAHATHIHYLGGILQILLKQPANEFDRSHGVRVAWGAGATAEVWRAFQDRFGIPLRECYGMTEASSFSTYNDTSVIGAVGHALPWFDVAVCDEDGQPVEPGARGEIVVRAKVSGALFQGYYANPEATQRALRNGALHTGDVGSWGSDGLLRFHGRVGDSMRCRGENVSAWEVEHVVATHPAVDDCAVIGVAAEIGEQDIKVFVHPKLGTTIDPAALSAWLAERLAPYQRPRYIAMVEGFERTPSQRIMKHKLSTATAGCWDRLASGRTRAPAAP